MCKNVMISVITYVKNGMPYIRECIESLINQDFPGLEIIIVDGGSVDNTLDFIRNIAKNDKRVVVLNSEASVGRQFNKALSVARGEYIAICESDDYVLPDTYSKLWTIAENTKCDVIRSDYEQFVGNNEKRKCFRTHAASKSDLYKKIIQNSSNILLDEGVNGFWSGLYKKSFLIDNEIFMSETPGASYQDVGFSFKCQCLAQTVYFHDEVFYQYRLDNPNASMNVKNRVNKMISEFVQLEDWLKKKKIWEKYYVEYFKWELTALKKAYINIDDVNKKEIYETTKIELKKQFDINKLSEEYLEFVSEFDEYIEIQEKEKRKFLNYLDNIHSDKRKIVIFGAGFLGEVSSHILTELYNVDYQLVDNNKKLQGTIKNNHEIFSLDAVIEDGSDQVYFVSNVNYAADIKKQLIEAKINEDNIYICNNDELLLRRILLNSNR